MDADDKDDLKKVVFFGCRTEEETKRDVVVVVVDANNADALVFIVVLRKTSVEKRGDTSVDTTTLCIRMANEIFVCGSILSTNSFRPLLKGYIQNPLKTKSPLFLFLSLSLSFSL